MRQISALSFPVSVVSFPVKALLCKTRSSFALANRSLIDVDLYAQLTVSIKSRRIGELF